VREGAREEHEHEEEEEDEESTTADIVGRGVLHKAHGIVPAKVHDDSHEAVPCDLDEDVGQDVGYKSQLDVFELRMENDLLFHR
jgi:hypothetical protein